MSLELEPQTVTFDDFGLDEKVLEAVRKMGFVEPTPIQKKSLPLVLEGRDLLGQAQTGTGKTAAFGIPIAQKLAPDSPDVQALIMCPTRELAVQVAEELHEICLFSGHKVLPIYGGQRIDRQLTALKKGVQVVVGTPGRILDHLGRGTLKLEHVKLLVLDEADMMLDMGFLPDIRRILRKTPPERQTLLFSATIPLDIQRISRDYMREPEFVSVVPETLTVQETEQIFYEVPEEEKIDALMRLLDYEEEGGTAMIFCRTKRNVDKLTRKLQSRGYDVEGLHGDLTQQQRDRIMAGFRENKFSYLVATDVAARGLDISHVTHVINFHIPQDPEAYVHRIGRTGRMGRAGVAITFVTPAEYWDLLRIQEFSMAQIEPGELPSAGEVEERRRAARGDEAARQRVLEADLKGRRPALEVVGDGEEGRALGTDEAQGAPAAEPKTRPSRRRPKEAEPFVALPEVGLQPTTEAERHQRRYTLRDSRKRIEWTEAEEAIKEAARIERQQLVEAVHDQAAEGERTLEAADALAGTTAAEERAGREAARALDLEERLREAERLAREAPPEPAEVVVTAGEGPAAEQQAATSAEALAASGGLEAAELLPIEVSAAAEAVAAEAELAPEEATPRRPRRRRTPKAADEAGAPAAAAEEPGAAAAEVEIPAKPGRRRRKPAQPEVSPAEGEGVLSADEEERIRAALRLRDRALELVAGLDQQGLADYEAIIDRVSLDHDLRAVTAALLRELAGREGAGLAGREGRGRARRGGRGAAPSAPPGVQAPGKDEEQAPSEEAMTRLFISIGRRARVSKDGLQKLVRETAGIGEEDIGRVDLLHNFAFIEVRKAVASLVIEKMHESMFKGREIQVERAKPVVKDEEQPEAAES